MIDLNNISSENEIKQYIESVEKEQKHLSERISAAKKKLKEVHERNIRSKLAIPFIPKPEERYCGYSFGGISWESTYSKHYDEQARLGNFFRTKDEAFLAFKKRRAETELLMMCDGFAGKTGVFITYDTEEKQFCADYSGRLCITPYRFESEESCMKAIRELGDSKLRLIFNIKPED